MVSLNLIVLLESVLMKIWIPPRKRWTEWRIDSVWMLQSARIRHPQSCNHSTQLAKQQLCTIRAFGSQLQSQPYGITPSAQALVGNLTPNQPNQPVLLNWNMRPFLANPYVAAHRQNYNSVIELHTVTHTLYGVVLDRRVLYVAHSTPELGNVGVTHRPHSQATPSSD